MGTYKLGRGRAMYIFDIWENATQDLSKNQKKIADTIAGILVITAFVFVIGVFFRGALHNWA